MKPLTGKFNKIIFRGEPWENYYETKFKARRAVVLHAVNQGWTLAECLDSFHAHELWVAGSDGRQLSGNETRKRIRKDHEAASERRRSNPAYTDSTDVKQFIGELRVLAVTWSWQGPAGRTDRFTIEYAHKTATSLGRDLINLSVRDVSLNTAISLKTASVSLRRLTAAGWLELVEKGQSGLAALYRITKPQTGSQEVTYISASISGEECMFPSETDRVTQEPDHEVWARLGKSPMTVYSTLSEVPIEACDAARRARVSRATAYRVLPVLEEVGLASKTECGWWARGPLTLDQAVESRGWVGKNSVTLKRRIQYDKERRLQRWNADTPQTATEAVESVSEVTISPSGRDPERAPEAAYISPGALL